MRNLLYIFLLLLFPSLAAARAGLPAAAADTVNPFDEILRIEEFYQSASATLYGQQVDLYFNFSYRETEKEPCYETVLRDDSVTVRSYLGRLRIDYAGREWMIQDSLYSITVSPSDSVIQVFKPAAIHTHLLGINLFDPKLYNGQIRNIIVSDSVDAISGAGLRKLLFRFNNESNYISFQVVYDTVHYALSNVQCLMRKEPMAAGLPYLEPSTWLKYELKSTGRYVFYEETDIGLFSTNLFFRKWQGKFEPLPPYTDYLILNNTFQ